MFPNDQSFVYDWCFDQEQRSWVKWMDTVPEFKCDPDKPFSQVMVIGRQPDDGRCDC